MCDNEYVAHAMVKERLREAEARGAFNAMLRQASPEPERLGRGAAKERPRPTRLGLWWQASTAWAVHLALPKMWNRL
jgi:hypothetical protein